MRFLELLIVVALLALAVYLVLPLLSRDRRRRTWQVVTRARDDGAYVVAVRGPGGERVVRELPAALEGPDLTAELRLAREEAQAQADELNRNGP